MGNMTRRALLTIALMMLVANGGFPLATHTDDMGGAAGSPSIEPLMMMIHDWTTRNTSMSLPVDWLASRWRTGRPVCCRPPTMGG